MKFSGKVGNGPVNKCLNFGGDPRHRLDTGIVSGREIRKMVSTDCAARRCSEGHALAGITIATPTSLRHRHWRALSRCFEMIQSRSYTLKIAEYAITML